MKRICTLVAVVLLPSLQATPAVADVVTYTNQTDFIAATASTLLTLPNRDAGCGAAAGDCQVTIPGQLRIVNSVNAGGLISGPDLFSGAAAFFTLAPNFLGRSGNENFDITALTTIYSFGFTLYEPTSSAPINGCNFVCEESTFVITLFSGVVEIGSLTIEPLDNAFDFYGFQSTDAITSVTIREIVGTPDNEFFGRFYTGTAQLETGASVPEPATLGLLGLGLAGMGLVRKRKAASLFAAQTRDSG